MSSLGLDYLGLVPSRICLSRISPSTAQQLVPCETHSLKTDHKACRAIHTYRRSDQNYMYVQVFCIVHENSWHCREAAPSLLEFCLAFAKPVQKRQGQLILCVYSNWSTLYTAGEKKAGQPARSRGGRGQLNSVS